MLLQVVECQRQAHIVLFNGAHLPKGLPVVLLPQVYIGGVFAAAVLDDIVMEPLTGRLMGVLYK